MGCGGALYLPAPDADKSTSIGNPLRISLAESPLEVGRFNLLAFRIAKNRQGRTLPVLAQMMRPMRQPVVVADKLAVKFLGFFNRFTPLPLIFAEPGFDPEITLDQVLPRMCDLKKKMASGGSKIWRTLYPESTTYEMLQKPGWKH
jgi:hypothetical protein